MVNSLNLKSQGFTKNENVVVANFADLTQMFKLRNPFHKISILRLFQNGVIPRKYSHLVITKSLIFVMSEPVLKN